MYCLASSQGHTFTKWPLSSEEQIEKMGGMPALVPDKENDDSDTTGYRPSTAEAMGKYLLKQMKVYDC